MLDHRPRMLYEMSVSCLACHDVFSFEFLHLVCKISSSCNRCADPCGAGYTILVPCSARKSPEGPLHTRKVCTQEPARRSKRPAQFPSNLYPKPNRLEHPIDVDVRTVQRVGSSCDLIQRISRRLSHDLFVYQSCAHESVSHIIRSSFCILTPQLLFTQGILILIEIEKLLRDRVRRRLVLRIVVRL